VSVFSGVPFKACFFAAVDEAYSFAHFLQRSILAKERALRLLIFPLREEKGYAMGSLAVVLIALVVYLLLFRRQDVRDIYQSSLIAVGAMVVLFIVSASATGTVQCMEKAQGFQNMSSLPGIACKDVARRR
jgi:hypothetical protein